MTQRTKYRKGIAAFLLTLVVAQTLLPVTAMALTSGPAQPEASSFAQAGTADMVDPFTGDFKYNLPLMDVDGYPLNLSYQSGSGMDDEASWTGLGWNLNVGAITRQLRGIPDDHSGSQYITEHYTKPKITIGARKSIKAEFSGFPSGLGVSGSLSLGIFSDNYAGIGAELGANAGISYTFGGSGLMTAGMGVGITSSTASGVDVNPSLSLSYRQKVAEGATVSPGLSASLGYNTRGGLKDLSLGLSFSASAKNANNNFSTSFTVGGATISYNTEPVAPKIQVPYNSFSGSFSYDIGAAAFGLFLGSGGTGYVSVREVKSKTLQNPAFGFLYAERGKKRPDALMDFIREKESVIIPEIPNLAVPIATPDLFSYTSQAGSGQFRLHRGGTGIFFDNEAADESNTYSLGFDAGTGGIAHWGVTLYNQGVTNTTSKWNSQNNFQQRADFQDPSSDPQAEHVFFKQVGEKNQEDDDMARQLQETEPIAVTVNQKTAATSWRAQSNVFNIDASGIAKRNKEKKRTAISYLTAAEAHQSALDKYIYYYDPITYNPSSAFVPSTCSPVKNNFIFRTLSGLSEGPGKPVLTYRDKNHISEITVTDESGKRNVYGIPVYNAYQKEYSYAIGRADNAYDGKQLPADVNRNLITQSDNGTSITQHKSPDNDHYLHMEKQPGYATSFLLTGILSPDYVDVTDNGITDDDLGTAIKFNYSRLPYLYQWRSPFGIGGVNKATIAKGLLADPDDDKASFVQGAKELWYIHSVETKTNIAYFITEDRNDAMGVDSWNATGPGGVKQKMLREIRLYSKADLSKPIKVVKLDYEYLLCRNVPNYSGTGAGKLTLTKVSFQYAKSEKGLNHPYIFHYNNDGRPGQDDQPYGFLQTDRWGNFKSTGANTANGFSLLRNDEFPYVTKSDADADKWAGTWQLSEIELPTGGKINVTYESDDYGYVQNKKAMSMIKPEKMITSGAGGNPATATEAASLRNADGVQVEIPEGKSADETGMLDFDWFIGKYLNGSSYLYTKFFVNVGGYDSKSNPSNEAYYDFIPCYAKIKAAHLYQSGGKNYVNLIFESIKDGGETMNPITHAAWQRMRMEYGRFSYPGYRNRIRDNDIGKAIQAVVSAIVNAARTLDELRRNFYKRASDEGFANNIILGKSMVRIAEVDGFKNGGGARVKRIMISDNWATMSGNSQNLTRTYGQEYDYTTTIDGKVVSSGVASFEPSIGNDENPWRLPVPYVQNIKGALNNLFNLEEPFGESLFPGPSVGYSKVIVRDLGEGGVADPAQKTGYVVNEFYTAKDFPVITKSLSNKVNQRGPAGWYSFFGGSMVHELTFSQGYSIELNDMHGKPKAIRVYNQSGSEISSTVYHYNAEPLNAGELKLKNVVNVVNEKGEIEENKIIGREIEVFTDMRQQETNSTGQTVQVGVDIVQIATFTIPWPHWPYKINDDYKLFRSASTMKVIQYYGILDKVVKTENGSTTYAENIAYDGITGEALITKTYNEFEDPIYTVNFPAYWMYPGMSGAYNTIGTIMPNFSTTLAGTISSLAYDKFLQSGDELIAIDGSAGSGRYWVIETAPDNSGSLKTKKIVDASGKIVDAMSNATVKVIRSGYRNMLLPPAASMVCLRNPISENPHPATGKKYIVFSKDEELAAWKVLTASAARFDDNWGAAPNCPTCPAGYELNADGVCELPPIENESECFNICPGSQPVGTYGIHGAAIFNPATGNSTDITSDFWGGACSGCGGGGAFMASDASTNSKQLNVATQQSVVTPMATFPNCGSPNMTPNNPPCGSNKCGRLIRSGIWLCAQNQNNPGQGEWLAFEFCVNIPAAGTYSLGYACDNKFVMEIDGQSYPYSMDNSNASNYEYWHVRQYTFNTAGTHTIKLTVNNYQNGGGDNAASVGLEIYRRTYAELIVPGFTPSEEDIIFSTARDLLNKRVQVYRHMDGSYNVRRYTCPIPVGSYSPCNGCGKIPIDRAVNPYVTGFRGNWRPMESKGIQVNRANNDLFNDKKKGVDIRNGGTLTSFKPFWAAATATANWAPNTTIKEWVTANTVTLYDKYGQELENKDALDKYSAAGFVFKGELPGAVASNARNREIVFESFEDLLFNKLCNPPVDNTACKKPAFKIGDNADLSGDVSGIAHSGNYALHLPAPLTLTTMAHDKETKSSPYTVINNKGEYTITPAPTLFPLGFEPVPGRTYVFSAWVKENQPLTTTPPGISVTVNGNNITLKRKAHVEKWSLLEGLFSAPLIVNPSVKPYADFSLTITPGAASYIDDIRIHPFDAHMKTYAYDQRTLRLMAELDENNFASFYEYDDEGSLVRVKKETERGIMTIKENRSSQRKRPE